MLPSRGRRRENTGSTFNARITSWESTRCIWIKGTEVIIELTTDIIHIPEITASRMPQTHICIGYKDSSSMVVLSCKRMHQKEASRVGFPLCNACTHSCITQVQESCRSDLKESIGIRAWCRGS